MKDIFGHDLDEDEKRPGGLRNLLRTPSAAEKAAAEKAAEIAAEIESEIEALEEEVEAAVIDVAEVADAAPDSVS